MKMNRLDRAGFVFIASLIVLVVVLAGFLFASEAHAQDDPFYCPAAPAGATIWGDRWTTRPQGEGQPVDGPHWQPCHHEFYVKPTASPTAGWSYQSTAADLDLWCGVPEVDNPMAQPLTVTLRPSSDYDLCVWQADERWPDEPKYARCFAAIIADDPPAGYVDGSGRSEDRVDEVTLPMGAAGLMVCADRYDYAYTGGWILEASLMPAGGAGD